MADEPGRTDTVGNFFVVHGSFYFCDCKTLEEHDKIRDEWDSD
jgi:hypothetical protein